LAWTGDYYLWFGGIGASPSTQSVSQTVTIDPLSTQFSLIVAWVANAGSVVTATIDGIPVLVLDDSTPFGVFSKQTGDVTAFADGNEHLLVIESAMTGANAFIDDAYIEQVPCLNYSNIPWLGLTQTSGSNEQNTSTTLSVLLDSTGLNPGEHTANLCVETNVPDGDGGTETVVVPVSLNVLWDSYLPVVFK
jgi:hypothetical protein